MFRRTLNAILFVCGIAAIFSVWTSSVHAQEVYSDYRGTYRAKVLDIIKSEKQILSGLGLEQEIQTLRVEILDGPQKDTVVEIQNDHTPLRDGMTFYFNYLVDTGGAERYVVTNIDRRGSLFVMLALFCGFILLFGGRQGVRALLALCGSFFVIFFVLLPGLLAGWNPLFASFLVSSGVLFMAIFVTHGFNRESVVAYVGTVSAVLLTTLFALFSVSLVHLTGFTGEETVYLDIGTKGMLNFRDLLLGGIIIGMLGVLDDIAVTQAAVVTELYASNPHMSKREVYRKALRVGKEHVGALVNTIVLAYTGASLPLLLYMKTSDMNVMSAVNMEMFATEIVRSVVGSVGLIMTVPIVTLLAVFFLRGYQSTHHHHHHH